MFPSIFFTKKYFVYSSKKTCLILNWKKTTRFLKRFIFIIDCFFMECSTHLVHNWKSISCFCFIKTLKKTSVSGYDVVVFISFKTKHFSNRLKSQFHWKVLEKTSVSKGNVFFVCLFPLRFRVEFRVSIWRATIVTFKTNFQSGKFKLVRDS